MTVECNPQPRPGGSARRTLLRAADQAAGRSARRPAAGCHGRGGGTRTASRARLHASSAAGSDHTRRWRSDSAIGSPISNARSAGASAARPARAARSTIASRARARGRRKIEARDALRRGERVEHRIDHRHRRIGGRQRALDVAAGRADDGRRPRLLGNQEQPAAQAPPERRRGSSTPTAAPTGPARRRPAAATTGTTGPASTRAPPSASAEQRVHAVAARSPRASVVSASSRGGDLPAAAERPVSAASTNCVWNSMRTGASSAENDHLARATLSDRAAARRRSDRAPRASDRARRRGSSAGTAAAPSRRNSVSAQSTVATPARSGNSWYGSTKYCGADQRVHREHDASTAPGTRTTAAPTGTPSRRS